MKHFGKVDIITSTLHNSWGYIQKAYNATRVHQNNIHKGNIRLRMKHKQKLNDIHPASPGCRPGTYPLIEEEAEEELQTSKHRARVKIIGKPVPATVVVVIYEPRGLSNPITMGIKTSKA